MMLVVLLANVVNGMDARLLYLLVAPRLLLLALYDLVCSKLMLKAGIIEVLIELLFIVKVRFKVN